MQDESLAVPTCPGCHFGCSLDYAQCARGLRFHDKWLAGEEIPVRRTPWERGEGKDPREGAPTGEPGEPGHTPARDSSPSGHTPPPHLAKLPTSARLMMLMTLFTNVQRMRDENERDRRVAECILRQDGSATNRIIAERTRFDDTAIDTQATQLAEQGLVESHALEDGRIFHGLTEAGRAQVQVWMEERKAADAELFAALSEDEQDQLEALLAKALGPLMKRPRPHGGPKGEQQR